MTLVSGQLFKELEQERVVELLKDDRVKVSHFVRLVSFLPIYCCDAAFADPEPGSHHHPQTSSNPSPHPSSNPNPYPNSEVDTEDEVVSAVLIWVAPNLNLAPAPVLTLVLTLSLNSNPNLNAILIS